VGTSKRHGTSVLASNLEYGSAVEDIDIITPSTESTSILTDATLINIKKTRAMAAWAERRSFTTAIQERLFDASFRRQDDEPASPSAGSTTAHRGQRPTTQ
jgi:hypothetical protein